MKGVKSWMKHNDRELKRDIKIKDLGVPVTLEEEQVPEPPQLSEILAAATIRGKVSISIMAFTGPRPQVLGNVDGTDGLVLADFPDLDLESLSFTSVPAMVIIRREISKLRHQYFSFLNEKGRSYFLAYLREPFYHGRSFEDFRIFQRRLLIMHAMHFGSSKILLDGNN